MKFNIIYQGANLFLLLVNTKLLSHLLFFTLRIALKFGKVLREVIKFFCRGKYFDFDVLNLYLCS